MPLLVVPAFFLNGRPARSLTIVTASDVLVCLYVWMCLYVKVQAR